MCAARPRTHPTHYRPPSDRSPHRLRISLAGLERRGRGRHRRLRQRRRRPDGLLSLRLAAHRAPARFRPAAPGGGGCELAAPRRPTRLAEGTEPCRCRNHRLDEGDAGEGGGAGGARGRCAPPGPARTPRIIALPPPSRPIASASPSQDSSGEDEAGIGDSDGDDDPTASSPSASPRTGLRLDFGKLRRVELDAAQLRGKALVARELAYAIRRRRPTLPQTGRVCGHLELRGSASSPSAGGRASSRYWVGTPPS